MRECKTDEPTEIYTFDHYESEKLDMEEFDPETHKLGAMIKHTDFSNQDNAEMPGEPEFDTEADKVYTQDHDFVSILRQVKPGFVDLFEKAVDFYIEGDWLNA